MLYYQRKGSGKIEVLPPPHQTTNNKWKANNEFAGQMSGDAGSAAKSSYSNAGSAAKSSYSNAGSAAKSAYTKDSGTQRLVVLRGTADLNQSFFDATPIEEVTPLVRQALESNGFNVAAVRIATTGYTRFSTLSIELELNVFESYTAEQARQSAQIVLANAKRSWLGSSVNFLSSVKFQIVSDFSTIAPPSNTNTAPGGAVGTNLQLPNPNDFLGSLGSGLGLSTPFALLAAGVVVLLIARR